MSNILIEKYSNSSTFKYRSSMLDLSLTPNSIIFSIPLNGVHQGGIGTDFPWKNWSYTEIPWNFFNFHDPEFSSSSFCRVFWFRQRALCKTVTIEQLPRKVVPGYNRAFQESGGCQFLGKNPFCVLSNLVKIFCPDITQIPRPEKALLGPLNINLLT